MSNILILDSKGEAHNISAFTEKLETLQRENETLKLRICLLNQGIALRKKSAKEKKLEYDKLLVDFEKLNAVMKDRDRMIDGMIHTISDLRRENMFERSDTERSDTVGRAENPMPEGQSPIIF
jgi:hypothetical protein